jgi:hypothetical protein
MLRVNFFRDPYCFVAFLYGEILGSEKRNGTNWPIRTSNAFEVGSQNDPNMAVGVCSALMH